MVCAVLARHIVDDLLPALVAEVHVNIRHGDALRVQEAFKQQLIFQRIQHRDAQRVRDNRPSAAAAPRPDHDALTLGIADKIPDDQEVIDIPHRRDDVQLIIQPLPRLVGLLCVGIALAQALMRQAGEHRQRGFALRHGIMRQTRHAELEFHIAAVGNLLRAVNSIRAGGEQRAHFIFALNIELARVHAHPVRVIKRLARLDAQQHFLRVCVLFLQVVAVVRRHQRHIHLAGKRNQARHDDFLLADAVIHDFNIEVLLAENILHFAHIRFRVVVAPLQQQLRQVAGQARGEANQPFAVLANQVVVNARAIIIAGQEALADQFHQVLIAGVVFTQEDEVAVLAVRGGFVQPVAADVDLAADDGLDARILHGGIEVDAAVHHAVVGDGTGGHAKRLDALDELWNAARAVQQGIFRVQMQVGETHGTSSDKNQLPFYYTTVFPP